MSNNNEIIQNFVEEYMEKIFYFCLKKTSNQFEAEDLTQDICLNVIIALNKGTKPECFYAWVWQIAKNRYSLWSKNKHKKNEYEINIDDNEVEFVDNKKTVIDDMIHEEELQLLRRELAFIKKEFRLIIVAYYIENKSIKDIANSLNLSIDVIHQRLHRARNILKEGMNMERKFGKKSYNPEYINFISNGYDGKNGQPWSIITHLMYKNIFLEVYKNPETAEELALELGIALPYMESELEFLVKQELLKKIGNKYETNFNIISKEEQTKIFETNNRIKVDLTKKLCTLIDLYIKENGKKVNISYVGYENAKWAILVRVFDYLLMDMKKQNPEFKETEHPKRPDGGAWTVIGYEVVDFKEPNFVGLHGCYNETPINNINYGQYKFYAYNLYNNTPEHLISNDDLTIWLVCNNRVNECEKEKIEKLINYGYLKKKGNIIEPNIVIFNNHNKDEIDDKVMMNILNIKKEIIDLFKKAPLIERGYIIDQAIENGWLKYDENTINTVGAFIYI